MSVRLPAFLGRGQFRFAQDAALAVAARPRDLGGRACGEQVHPVERAVLLVETNGAVFDLVAWWAAENRALERAHKALRLQSICPFDREEPFAAIIRCTGDPTKVDKRTRSKWSRALRYALRYKSHSEPLDQFIKRKGGINTCASRFTRCLERAAA